MDLRVTSTGKIFRRIDSAIAGLLCDALPSVFEPVAQLPPRPAIANAESASIKHYATPQFGIWHAPMSGRVAIKCSYGAGEYFFDGKPENARTFKVGTAVPPQEVIEEYVRQYVGNQDWADEVAAEKRRLSVDSASEAQFAQSGTNK